MEPAARQRRRHRGGGGGVRAGEAVERGQRSLGVEPLDHGEATQLALDAVEAAVVVGDAGHEAPCRLPRRRSRPVRRRARGTAGVVTHGRPAAASAAANVVDGAYSIVVSARGRWSMRVSRCGLCRPSGRRSARPGARSRPRRRPTTHAVPVPSRSTTLHVGRGARRAGSWASGDRLAPRVAGLVEMDDARRRRRRTPGRSVPLPSTSASRIRAGSKVGVVEARARRPS